MEWQLAFLARKIHNEIRFLIVTACR